MTDIRYGDNLQINPFEVGLEYTVDLDKPARFIGQDALRRIADGTTPRRHAVAFTIEGEAVPDLETFWPVKMPGDGEQIGVVWQAGYSYALEQHAGDALLDQPAEIGTPLELESPSGPISATVVAPARPRSGNRTLTRLTAAGHAGGLITTPRVNPCSTSVGTTLLTCGRSSRKSQFAHVRRF